MTIAIAVGFIVVVAAILALIFRGEQVFYYKVTPQTLEKLEESNLPIKAFRALEEEMLWRDFKTETEFLEALKDAIGEQTTQEYKDIILQNAKHRKEEIVQEPTPTPTRTVQQTPTSTPEPTPTLTPEPTLPPMPPLEEPINCTYKNIQVVLSQKEEGLDLYDDDIDGKRGDNTKAALRIFQNKNNLKPTETSDRETCQKMASFFDQYRDEIAKYQRWSCFKPGEYSKLFEERPQGKEILGDSVIAREKIGPDGKPQLKDYCIYVDKISDKQKEQLRIKVYEEIVRKVKMAPE